MSFRTVLVLSDDDSRREELCLVAEASAQRLRTQCLQGPDDVDGLACPAEAPVILALVSCRRSSTGLRGLVALRSHYPELAILVEVGAEPSLEVLQAIRLGASDWLKSPVSLWEWVVRIQALVRSQRQRATLGRTWRRLRAIQRGRRQRDELPDVLARLDGLHHPVTGAHDQRTGRIAALIAEALGLPTSRCDLIGAGAALHDIGKTAIPDHVLHHPGKFSDKERAVMLEHPRLGWEILRHGQSDILRQGAEIALSHHERFDGSGYPQGLASDAIPLAGRITAVADVFDALTNGRGYRAALSAHEVMDYLQQRQSEMFDTDCVQALGRRLDAVGQSLTGTH